MVYLLKASFLHCHMMEVPKDLKENTGVESQEFCSGTVYDGTCGCQVMRGGDVNNNQEGKTTVFGYGHSLTANGSVSGLQKTFLHSTVSRETPFVVNKSCSMSFLATQPSENS